MVYENFFEIIIYIVEAFILYYYANSFFEKKGNSVFTIGLCALTYVALFVIYQFGNSLVNAIFLIIANIFIFVFLFRAKLTTAIFNSILLTLIMVSTEVVVIAFTSYILKIDFNDFENNMAVYIIEMSLNKLAYAIICIVIAKRFSKKNLRTKSSLYFGLLFIIPVASLFVLLLLRFVTFEATLSNHTQLLLSIASLFLLASNIALFFIYDKAIQNETELSELKSIKLQEEIDETYLNILEKANEDLNVFLHNTKNHFNSIYHLSSEKEVKDYVNELSESIGDITKAGISKNRVLDILINKYEILCDTKGISISFDVKTANLSFVQNTDLSTLVNNLLDNAVRAAELSEEKCITVEICSVNKSMQILSVINSCDEKPIVENKTLRTTKFDKSKHGFGVKGIKAIAEKYHGDFEWNYDEITHIFEAIVVLTEN